MDVEDITSTEELPEETRRARARHLSQQAIQLAMQGRWQDAIDLNLQIAELTPNDAEAHNRLGKAYSETGQIAEAREAYQAALAADAANLIAQRNLERLSRITDAEVAELTRRSKSSLDPRFFMEETGKTAVVSLQHPAAPTTLVTLSAGDQVKLETQDSQVVANTMDGTYIGRVDDQLSARLIRLINAGNEYQAGVVGVDGNTVRIIIRETHQSPQNVGRISFPPRTAPETLPRPYLREGLMRRSGDEEDEDELDVDLDAEPDEDEEDPSEFGFHEGALDET
jgi:tetratricopeptide (TPR) repeat protein